MDATDQALGRLWRDDHPWTVLTTLTELDNRFAGRPGERRAAEILADALIEAGVRNVTTRPFDLQCWSRGNAELVVSPPGRDLERSFETVALPYSPPYAGEAPLVDAGHATPDELDETAVAGSVVLTETATPPELDRPYHRVEKVAHAAAAGAEAFVFVNHVPGQLPPTGAMAFGHQAAIPGVGVSAESGAWLREYATDKASNGDSTGDDSGASRTDQDAARARLRVDATVDAGQARNVVGRVGPQTEESVVVVAHFDAHDVGEGALDNGCGVATVVGAVSALSAMELDREVRIALVSGEEIGLLGSERLADRRDLDSIHAVVNVDGAGRFRDLQALTHGSEAVADLARDVLTELDHPLAVGTRPHPYSDHWPFVRAGVPAVQLHSVDPDADRAWDRGWTHTRADTRDKADPRTIREHAMLTALLVRELTRVDLPRIDPADVRDSLVDAGVDAGMAAAGIWPDDWER